MGSAGDLLLLVAHSAPYSATRTGVVFWLELLEKTLWDRHTALLEVGAPISDNRAALAASTMV